MKTTEQDTGQAPVTCAQIHRETARTLRAMFKDGLSSQKDGRMRVALHLNRMARAAGIDPTTYEIKARWLLYLRAARALSRAGKLAASAYAKQVQVAVIKTTQSIERFREWEREREREQSVQSGTATITLSKQWEAATLAPFNLAPGDKLELELITDTPRVGETIALKQKEESRCVTFGNFVGLFDNDDDVECVWFIDENGAEYGYERATHNVWRIKSVTRTTLYAAAADSATSELERKRKLDVLRRRLDKLNDDDSWEAHCSDKRFKLEKQIYDLEHAPDTEEWPEVIGGAR
jgi:hypothetical protein